MSTRCTVHFEHEKGSPQAVVYRHCDGYPEGDSGFPADFARFLEAVKKDTSDTRFHDPCYLAAKYVVWQANENAQIRAGDAKPKKMLDFLSVGIVMADPCDIRYRYHVLCSDEYGKEPTLEWEEVQ